MRQSNRRLKRIWFKAVFLVVAAPMLILSACADRPRSQEPCNFIQNSYGQRVSWKDNVPVTLYLHASFPEEYRVAVTDAMSHWNNRMGRNIFVLSYDILGGPVESRQDGRSVIYWKTNWDGNKPNEQGRTSTFSVGDQIQEADVQVNGFHFKYFVNTPMSRNEIHLTSLLVHELGHVLGLQHNDDAESFSVMATYLAPNVARDAVSNADVDSLQCEY